MTTALNQMDWIVIGIYFLSLIVMGFALKKRAGQSLDDYYLGGRKLPWWALGFSGMASYVDITGTTLITAFLFLLGPRGLYIEFRAGAALVLVFVLLWLGKWHRRSGCMTGAEWMTFRFGSGFGGEAARIVAAVSTIAMTIGLLAYLCKGVGLFLSIFLGISPFWASVLMFSVATAYTVASGFYGVVFSDIFQSVLILCVVIGVSVMTMMKVAEVGDVGALAQSVTGNSQWMSIVPQWKVDMPMGYEKYNLLALCTGFFLLRMLLQGLGEGADPKYFGAKSDRDCGLLTFQWIWLFVFRWPLMISFAVLGLFLIRDIFPDLSAIGTAAQAIKDSLGRIPENEWPNVLAALSASPDQYPELCARLRELLGAGWADKLSLVGFHGTINAERIMPTVILYKIPLGLRGLVLVPLIAASMSSFDSVVNKASGFFVKDIYQRYLRPHAANRELIRASYLCTLGMVVAGFWLGYYAESINQVWSWFIMGLGTGLGVPMVLRFYWWRFTGVGFVSSTLAGLIGAVVLPLLYPEMNELLTFTLMLAISTFSALVGTWATPPAEDGVLENFYRTTRPFGFWKPYRQRLSPQEGARVDKENRNDLLALPFAFFWQVSLLLLSMQVVLLKFDAPFFATLALFSVSLGGLYWFWFRNLPPAKGEGVE